MSSRTQTRATLLLLLLALTAPTLTVGARDGGAPWAQRMIEGAQKGAIYDKAGRVVKTTVPTPDSEKVTVSLRYDGQNRVQSVVLDDGTQIGLLYDAAGLWQGFSFADGGKMLFERDASGQINGLRRVVKATRQQSRVARGDTLRRVGLGAPRVVDACAEATVAAVTAAASAVAICALGAIENCVTATATAAVAAMRAYRACRDTSASEGSAV